MLERKNLSRLIAITGLSASTTFLGCSPVFTPECSSKGDIKNATLEDSQISSLGIYRIMSLKSQEAQTLILSLTIPQNTLKTDYSEIDTVKLKGLDIGTRLVKRNNIYAVEIGFPKTNSEYLYNVEINHPSLKINQCNAVMIVLHKTPPIDDYVPKSGFANFQPITTPPEFVIY